mgnify:CR=1 FL=1
MIERFFVGSLLGVVIGLGFFFCARQGELINQRL